MSEIGLENRYLSKKNATTMDFMPWCTMNSKSVKQPQDQRLSRVRQKVPFPKIMGTGNMTLELVFRAPVLSRKPVDFRDLF